MVAWFELNKRRIAIGLLAVVVFASFLYFVAVPRIAVTGTGTVMAYPDEAHLLFSVRTQNQSAADAAAENGAKMSIVFSSLAAIGVNKSDIKTISYSLTPTYDSYNYSKVIGYVAINSVEVMVIGAENLPNVGKIIDAVVQAGVNQVDGIDFTFVDPNYNALRTEAYQKAVRDAYSQASGIVGALGGVIIGVASVSTNFGYGIIQPQVGYGDTNVPKPVTPIESGPQQVTATVNITYLYL